jgi:hypothetical protein
MDETQFARLEMKREACVLKLNNFPFFILYWIRLSGIAKVVR